MRNILLGIFLFTCNELLAQYDSVKVKPALIPFAITGYAEIYYAYDFNRPSNNSRPGFIYSHNRHNEFNLNLGYLKGSYNAERVRSNLALAAGTYVNANYSAEPAVLKNIFEANVGLKISKKKDLWVDAGIFASHIGFESAVSKDCWALTRSILADNTPYFESGVKLTYSSNNSKWLISGLVLNGWQRIKRADGNSLLSFGTQLQYKPNATATLNYSTFIGTDKPDSVRLMRYYQNLYGIFNITGKFGIIAGFDFGAEQKRKGSNDLNTWYTPVIILKYALNSKFSLTARCEHYNDKHGVIITSGTANGFQTTGVSINLDYAPLKNALIRLEARTLKSKDDVFLKGANVTNNNTFISSSIAVNF